jgi:MFS family permease
LILQRQGDGALSNLPLYYLGTSVSFLAFAIPAGRLADRVGRARVYLGGHVVLVGVYAVVLLAGRLDGIAVLAVLCGHGAYYAATDGVLAALASSLVPKDAQGTGLGAVATGTSLAKLASSVLLGLTWTWVGPVGVVLLSAVSTSAVLVWAAMVLTRLDRADANGTASLRVR